MRGKSASKSCGLICGHALACETVLIAVMKDFQRADSLVLAELPDRLR